MLVYWKATRVYGYYDIITVIRLLIDDPVHGVTYGNLAVCFQKTSFSKRQLIKIHINGPCSCTFPSYVK